MKYWFPVALYCCMIFGVSSISTAQLPETLPNLDKLVHMSEYALLAALFARAVRHTSQREWHLLIWVMAIFFVAFYGITDEFHQSFVAGRSSDLADWLAGMTATCAATTGRWFGSWFFSRLGFGFPFVIGFIESGTLKDHPGSGTDQSLEFGLAAFRALGKFSF